MYASGSNDDDAGPNATSAAVHNTGLHLGDEKALEPIGGRINHSNFAVITNAQVKQHSAKRRVVMAISRVLPFSK